jgi:hypothetical protein
MLPMNRRSVLLLSLCCIVAPYANAGAWDSGSFGNDDAMDWVGDCVRSTGTKYVASTLEKATKNDFLESPDCSSAIAAAEVVAAARGKANLAFPKALQTWIEKQSKDELAKLAPTASKAVTRILNGPQSELLELWKEGKSLAEWQGKMNDLLARLKN